VRPLSFGEILSGSFTLVRKNPAAMFGLIGLGDLAGIAVGLVVGVIAAITGTKTLAFVVYPPLAVVQFAVWGGLLAAAGRAYLGQKLRLTAAAKRSRRAWTFCCS
jgi:hypothetical protein